MGPTASAARVLLRRPTDKCVRRFLDEAARAPLSYAEIGASLHGAPSGYDLDHNRARIGTGRAAFERARDAVLRFAMFPPGWSRVVRPDGALAVGQTVCVQFHLLGLYWLNATRIVSVFDEPPLGESPLVERAGEGAQPIRRAGFAYGTLDCHVERGEECFAVEWLSDDSVWYDLRAFSRPRLWAARVAKPVARALQRRFVRDSQAALRAAVTPP